jgi:hypothetical protein
MDRNASGICISAKEITPDVRQGFFAAKDSLLASSGEVREESR